VTRYDSYGFAGITEKGVESVDREAFDRLSRLVAAAGTRRAALRLLLGGAVMGVAAGAEETAARQGRRGRRQRGKVRAQQVEPLCPTTCNQNCSNKPLHGGVNLTKCDFNGDDLDGVNLRGSNLSKACFENSSLRFANFRGTNASKTCFCGADLTGADFRGSNVTKAQLDCAVLACNTILPNGKPAQPCNPGETCCDGECVDLEEDPVNCGRCGKRCQIYQVCQEGGCTCAAASPVSDCSQNPGWSCCAPDSEPFVCDCALSDSGVFTLLDTCDFGPCEQPNTPCVGPVCQACCPPESTCDPSTGTCLR
jgi:hypothetical protein